MAMNTPGTGGMGPTGPSDLTPKAVLICAGITVVMLTLFVIATRIF